MTCIEFFNYHVSVINVPVICSSIIQFVLLQQEEFTQDDDLYNDVITASSSVDSVEVRILISILFF